MGKPACTKAQEGVPAPQSGSPTTNTALIGKKNNPAKVTPKVACSALSGDLTAVTLITKHSIFIKWPQIKLLELKRGFLHQESVSPMKKMTWISQKHALS